MGIKNGDMPAMPFQQHGPHGLPTHEAKPGLTKREMMAVAAMRGLLTNSSGGYSDYKYMARDAVTAADALLAELDRTSTSK